MRLEWQILLALLLDILVGDPRRLPHPVRLIGKLAALAEARCRPLFTNQYGAGIAAVLVVVGFTGLGGACLLWGARLFHPGAETAVSVLLLYFCLAAKDLGAHGKAVQEALEAGDIPAAREKVAMIVGRDTAHLEEEAIVKAGVESVAENIVDGVTAPLFYAVIGGPVGALVYKAVNTLDSTFGYKNERYRQFGWAAARLDDLMNFVPARISGLLSIQAAFLLGLDGRRAWRIFRRDRLRHASPNSGHAEAAVAGALGLQLGGTNMYFGEPVHKPTIGDAVETPRASHIGKTIQLLFATTLLASAAFLGARLLLL